MSDWRKIRASAWRSWLDGLPDEIYDKRDSAHIVRLMDALCGDNGVGFLRKSLILKRLQTSLYETRYGDLDTVYSALFGLPRLESEQYSYNEDGLLLWSEIAEMDIKDAHYRKRIWDYMLSFQYGGTTEGVALAAQAATGLPCEVVDGCIYYSSLGIPESEQGSASGEPLNFESTVDFNGATIVVMSDSELTAEQQRNLSDVTSRIRPVDVHYTFMTRKELMDMLAFTDIEDDYIEPVSVDASSRWWNVVRTVTGRPDWSLGSAGGGWVEANVPKEAPQQLLSNRQESEYDFTSLAVSCAASSEHVGRYNPSQRDIFPSLAENGASVVQEAGNALSRASNRIVSSGYYGSESVIDGAYPMSYAGEMTSFFMEEGRSHRFWSSSEREGSEWVEFELKRLVPVNHVSMAVFRKPVRVKLFYSSYEDEDGRVWRPARDDYGRDLSFTYPEWGSPDDSEMVAVDFISVPVKADAVRIEFERLGVQYRSAVDDDTYEVEEFLWSVECADVSIGYSVLKESDFIATTYEDMFGNRVDTSLRTMDASHVLDGDPGTYWLSQPNIGDTAVEYLVVKVSDEPVRMNFIDIEAIYGGCQLNIYSCDKDDCSSWTPYPGTYILHSGRYELPMRKVTYIKLEFTGLCAMPYDLCTSGAKILTRRFPWDIRSYCEDRYSYTYEQTVEAQLLDSPQLRIAEERDVQNTLGIESLYSTSFASSGIGSPAVHLIRNGQYRNSQDNVIRAIYGDDTAWENSYIPSPQAESIGEPVAPYKFNFVGEHVYDEQYFERALDLAYVVGVKDVKFGFTGRILTAKQNDTFYLYMQDGRFLDSVDGWEFVSGERLGVSSESLNRFDTVNLQSVYPFRSFEFASNQKKPVEKFEHPSNMVEEWHGLDSDTDSVEFGVSGTVLKMTNASVGSGIESEPKLTRSMAIATSQVDVYPMLGGTWQFDCYDLFGESVYSMRYELEPMRWTTVGVNFVPTPGGSWWDDDYAYRVRVPVAGPIAKGQHVFTPVVDLDALETNGMLDSGLNKLRLVYFNGVSVHEIPIDMTDNMEIWFETQQDLPDGSFASGAYDFDRKVLNGSYYFYFGGPPDSPSVQPAADSPLRDYKDVFPNRSYVVNGASVAADGTLFSSDGDMAVFDNKFFLPEEGFLSFEITLSDALEIVPSNTVGIAEVRFILDYEDDSKAIQMYSYERQLTFVIREKDGFESSFVSLEEDLLQEDDKSRVLVEWGVRGSAPVKEADPSDPTSTSVNPDNLNRRRIKVYVDSPVERDCIPNVYDEKHYIDVDKVY